MAAILALAVSVTYGVADFVGGLMGRRLPVMALVLWSQAIGLVMVLVVALGFPADVVRWQDPAWGALAGTAGTMGVYFLYRGLAEGRMTVVSPLTALVGAVIPVGVGVSIGERPVPLEWLGIAIALPAIWLVSTAAPTGEGSRSGGALMGLLAGLGFGLFFAAISRAGAGAGFWPLVGARAAQVLLVLTLTWRRRPGLLPPPGSRLGVLVVGMGDTLANVLLLLAFRSGMLTVVSVLASLYPAVTVLLAVVILSEPIGRRQLYGLVLALVAVGLIAV
jgi:drug/metabolite transporter (DMT)-like permease